MKKGFTLIELLIIIIIVGTLVGIALPKYSRAAERGRALEGINNVRYAAEYVGTTYAVSGKMVTKDDLKDITKNKFFDGDQMTVSEFSVTLPRKSGMGWSYSLTATSNSEGELISITCTNGTEEDHCTELGLVSGDLL